MSKKLESLDSLISKNFPNVVFGAALDWINLVKNNDYAISYKQATNKECILAKIKAIKNEKETDKSLSIMAFSDGRIILEVNVNPLYDGIINITKLQWQQITDQVNSFE